ncbi:MAG: RNA-binding protein [Thaumarchaeota archaeon]|nr:RNA-binding protein [Nitrososphaerota archaeon]
MFLKNVKTSLEKISKSLEDVHNSREYLIKNTREVVILCSQSIIAIHKGDLKAAHKKVQEAKKVLSRNRKMVKSDLRRYLITPEQELVEAYALLSIVEGKPIPSAKSLGVLNESYVLGLLDCIGELKRLVFDKIRTDKSKDAEKFFELMENLYLHLYPFATYDKIVREARRKIDVNRILIEDTRSAITEEIRRIELIKTLNQKK